MATDPRPPNEMFFDTSFAIALANSSDQLHHAALVWATAIKRTGRRLITTQAVVLEIGNALAKRKYRDGAGRLLVALQNDPSIEIVELSTILLSRAVGLFVSRHDKEWGLIDCVSFLVMRDRNLLDALTADAHFEQAGFRALLKIAPDEAR